MQEIKEIRPLKKHSQIKNTEYFFNEYYKKKIKNDNYLNLTFFQIIRQILAKLRIENNQLFLLEEHRKIDYITLILKDRLGGVRNSKVVKAMKPEGVIYEIRLDEQYIKHRVMFFPHTIFDSGMLVFCYAFSKTRGDKTHTGEDMTSILLENTREVKRLFITNDEMYITNHLLDNFERW